MRVLISTALDCLVVFAYSPAVFALCGFYLSKADASLFKLNLGQSVPPSSKSNAENVKQLDDAAKQFRESHPAHLEIGNLFQS
jgi:hypothetical protein